MPIGKPRKAENTLSILGNSYDLQEILLEDIYCDNEFNCRGPILLEAVQELAETIEEVGLMSPILVWKREGLPFGHKYQIVFGHRRFKACQLLKWEKMVCFVRDNLTLDEAKLINFGENLERSDLTVLEEARVLAQMFDKDMSLREVASMMKRSVRWVTSRRNLLDFPEDIQLMFHSGRLKISLVRPLWLHMQDEGLPAVRSAIKKHLESDDENSIRKHLKPAYLRKNPKRPTNKEINEVITMLFNHEVIGLGARVAAYCAGYIGQSDVLKDIEEESQKLDRLDALEKRIEALEKRRKK